MFRFFMTCIRILKYKLGNRSIQKAWIILLTQVICIVLTRKELPCDIEKYINLNLKEHGKIRQQLFNFVNLVI